MKIRWLLCLSLLPLVLALGACGSEPAAAPRPVEVQVTLSEFKIESSLARFAVGVPYHFMVTNKGQIDHELMIVQPVTGPMAMEEMHRMALMEIEEDHLPPGASQTSDFTFSKPYAAGEIEFACHVPGHYEAGMHLPLTVQ